MKFTYWDLGQRKRGEIVEITLSGNAANVRLLDDHNYALYRTGKQHRYFGGLTKTSPVQIPAPHGGHWHLVIDLGGYPGTVRASAQVHTDEDIAPGHAVPKEYVRAIRVCHIAAISADRRPGAGPGEQGV